MTPVSLPGGVASFTFDDFPVTAADTGARLLENAGWRGTFYLSPGLIDSESESGRIASSEDVLRLWDNGHEIGGHTYTHRRCVGVSTAELLHEEALCATALRPFGGAVNFAFPFGAYDEAALISLRGRYASCRTGQGGLNFGSTDLNMLRANPIYESSCLRRLAELAGSARSANGWLILYTHDVRASPSAFGCTPERFRAVLEIVEAVGLAVRTVGETITQLKSSHETPTHGKRRGRSLPIPALDRNS